MSYTWTNDVLTLHIRSYPAYEIRIFDSDKSFYVVWNHNLVNVIVRSGINSSWMELKIYSNLFMHVQWVIIIITNRRKFKIWCIHRRLTLSTKSQKYISFLSTCESEARENFWEKMKIIWVEFNTFFTLKFSSVFLRVSSRSDV